MLAATYTQGGAFAIEEIPPPRIDADGILLRVRAASICGTDLKIVRSGHAKLANGQRIVLGHEFLGVIEQVGARVRGYRVGQRVGVAPNAGCGRCDTCVRGKSNACPDYTAFGIDRDGAHAACVAVPGRHVAQGNVLPLPDGVSDEEASLLEPLSCVVNALQTVRLQLGDTVVLYGAGPMGLMHVLLCRAAGAARILVIDPLADRLARARQLGCDVVLDPARDDLLDRVRHETQGRGADVVITACPIADVQTQAVRLLAPFGRLCLFGGLPRGSGPVPLDSNAIHYDSLVVTGSTGGSPRDYRVALRLVAGKRIDPTRVISRVFALDELQAAYETARAAPGGKVVMVAR